jgi:hypothetical protein
MKTRLQLVQGLLNGTLTFDEKEVALANTVVMSEVKRIQNMEVEPKKLTRKVK